MPTILTDQTGTRELCDWDEFRDIVETISRRVASAEGNLLALPGHDLDKRARDLFEYADRREQRFIFSTCLNAFIEECRQRRIATDMLELAMDRMSFQEKLEFNLGIVEPELAE